MRTPAFGRARRRLRSVAARVTGGGRRLARAVLSPFDDTPSHTADGWERAWATREDVRWHRGAEHVECFRFDDGVVATVEYADHDSRFQLTTGPMPAAQALLAAAIYMQHGVTPQIDRQGRPFVAEADGTPTQVYRERPAEQVTFRYLDEVRTVEEFPPYVGDRDALQTVHERLAPSSTQRLHRG
jgi:hypothetical protein